MGVAEGVRNKCQLVVCISQIVLGYIHYVNMAWRGWLILWKNRTYSKFASICPWYQEFQDRHSYLRSATTGDQFWIPWYHGYVHFPCKFVSYPMTKWGYTKHFLTLVNSNAQLFRKLFWNSWCYGCILG